ncbi:pyridoxal-phosphate dependent enzyme [Streptomyces sp. NPDC089799]|uniref:pyridoxal-phosphate dependent enzyme n=1 Tax=Streptomyces sp. NPDC089799 TaxID=3155066 RepID=UPI0034476CBD
MLFDSVHASIGHTPLVRLRMESSPGTEVYAKLEMQNLFAMKDRVAYHIVREAKRTGALADGAPLVESSSGTMALGVALVGALLGHQVHIVTDPRIDRLTLAKLRSLGSTVHVVPKMTSQGWQSARLERLEELMAELPGAFWPQQYSNPDNPGAYAAVAEEILQDLGTVDVLVGAVGSGGSLCGTSRRMRRELPSLRVVGVDCVGSVLFGQPDRPKRYQSGLGNSLLPANLDHDLVDEVHWLNDHEAFAASRDLVRDQAVFAGNTAGSVYQVLQQLAREAPNGSRIVGIFPDRGDRYTDTVYSDEWWTESRLAEMERATEPEWVEYGTPVQSWSRAVVKQPNDDPRYLLFIESNTTGTGMAALGLARDLGLRPVLLTGRPERYVGLEETGSEVVTCDTNQLSEVRAAIQSRFRRTDLAGITTTSDFYVPTVAELAQWLGLPGNPAEAMTLCRDKAALRARLEEAGVGQPRFAVVGEDAVRAAVTDAVSVTGIPCVVKPVDDSGSNGVLLCGSAEEAAAHAERVLSVQVNVRGMPTAREVLVEQFLEGPEYSVEMFTGADGHHCVGITEKTVGGDPYFVENQHVFPAPLDERMAEDIRSVVGRALDAVGVRLGATHTEVKMTASGPAIVEINPRPAGGMIPELIRLATGVDLLEQQLRSAAGMPVFWSGAAHGAWAGIRFLIAEESGELLDIRGVEDARAVAGVSQVRLLATPGSRVRPARNSYDRLGYVIARADSADGVRGVLGDAMERLITDIKPSTTAGEK